MSENFVLDLLKISVELEIENEIIIKDDCIEITLPNGEVAILFGQFLRDKTFCESKGVIHDNDYVFNHDYGNIGENRANKLMLRTLQDIRDYAIDVAEANIIDVGIFGDIVSVPGYCPVQVIVSLIDKKNKC